MTTAFTAAGKAALDQLVEEAAALLPTLPVGIEWRRITIDQADFTFSFIGDAAMLELPRATAAHIERSPHWVRGATSSGWRNTAL